MGVECRMNVDLFLSNADYSSERIVNLNLNDPMNVVSLMLLLWLFWEIRTAVDPSNKK